MPRLVMVVDDHPLIRDTLCWALKAEGFSVCQAVDGAQAIQVAQERGPDLIVLDLAMPVMNGLEAARALKLQNPSLPLLMFTNTVGPLVEKEARLAGFAAVFSKTAPPALLIDAVRTLLGC